MSNTKTLVCPKCAERYDASWKICLHDKEILVIAKDPHVEIIKPEPVREPFRVYPATLFLVGLHSLLAFLASAHEAQQIVQSYGGWTYLFLCLLDPLVLPFFAVLQSTHHGWMLLMFLIIGGLQWFFIGQAIGRFWSRRAAKRK